MKSVSPEHLLKPEDRTEFREAALLSVAPGLTNLEEPEYFKGQDLPGRFNHLFKLSRHLVLRSEQVELSRTGLSIISSPKLVIGQVEDEGLAWPVTGKLNVCYEHKSKPNSIEVIWEITEFKDESRLYHQLRQQGKHHQNDHAEDLEFIESTIKRLECSKKNYHQTVPNTEHHRSLREELNEMARALEVFQRLKNTDDAKLAEKRARRRGESDIIGKAVVEALVGLI